LGLLSDLGLLSELKLVSHAGLFFCNSASGVDAEQPLKPKTAERLIRGDQ